MVGIIASMMVSPVAPHWGAWIEMPSRHLQRLEAQEVAPHWGAWIEMASFTPSATRQKSHPTGVRGLKWLGARHKPRAYGRTPLGCVD